MKAIFENIKKLFKYNWNQVFNNLVPNSNKRMASSEELKTMNVGSIVRIVAEIVFEISITAAVAWRLSRIATGLYGSTLSGLFASTFFASVPKMILNALLISLLPIGLLIYNAVMKQKEQTAWVYFISLIYCALSILYSLYKVFTSIIAMFLSPLFGLLALAGFAFKIIGNMNIMVGSIDFCTAIPHVQSPNTNNQNMNMNNGYNNPQMNNNMQMNNGYNNPQMNNNMQMNNGYNNPQMNNNMNMNNGYNNPQMNNNMQMNSENNNMNQPMNNNNNY